MATKYIFVTGGVVSSLGKGITAASIGRILKQKGLKVFMQKFDPYINIDPGTMSPYQHGEVFVTADGAETDLDLGHYERFIDENLAQESNVTAGRIYQTVIKKERNGDFEGKTVQVIPHVTDEIKNCFFKAEKNAAGSIDVVITEIGGTVGDIESLAFLEAIRQVNYELGKKNVAIFHTTLIPYLETAGEFKTKPSQYSVKELLSLGIQPDFLVCRSKSALSEDILQKLSLFCNVPFKQIISVPDCQLIYQVPLILFEQKIDQLLSDHFGWSHKAADMKEWKAINQKMVAVRNELKVAIVAKYARLTDAYLSVIEAAKIAGYHHNYQVRSQIFDAETFTNDNVASILTGFDAIIVPGGFGDRGIEGKIIAINYARTKKIPFLGICLGMQLACVEIARNLCGLSDANSTEFNSTTNAPIFALLAGKHAKQQLGGTLRLGNYPTDITDGSLVSELYQEKTIFERHRHRYEFNNKYLHKLQDAGVKFTGWYQQENLAEIIELARNVHPFFVGSQFHPEFTARINRPNPLFSGLIKAAIAFKTKF